jgi:hypothetical protein
VALPPGAIGSAVTGKEISMKDATCKGRLSSGASRVLRFPRTAAGAAGGEGERHAFAGHGVLGEETSGPSHCESREKSV